MVPLRMIALSLRLSPQDVFDPGYDNESTYPYSTDEHFSAVQGMLSGFVARTAYFLEGDIRRVSIAHGSLFNVESIANGFTRELASRLSRCVMRAFVLEMNVARLRGELDGSDGHERFHSFLHRFRNTAHRRSFFEEYSALTSDVVRTGNQLLESYNEICTHFVEDRERLRDRFLLQPNNIRVRSVQVGLGDQHCGGRTVSLLTFEDGSQLVYKPRSLQAEEKFQELIRWLNQELSHLQLRTLLILDRKDHGWMEYVIPAPLSSAEQLHAFYRRLGRLLCLLYVLRAGDFHCENLIAAGEQPVLIDCESLMNSVVRSSNLGIEGDSRESSNYSVLSTGLLPRHGEIFRALDNSGIGGAAGQPYPERVAHWEQQNTDEMRVTYRDTLFKGANNQPSLEGKLFSVDSYTDDVWRGFEEGYNAIVRKRDDLESLGLVQAFANAQTRVIVRATITYSRILRDLRHTDLSTLSAREHYLDQIFFNQNAQPISQRICEAERLDLLRGDIPYFCTRPDSTDIWTSEGRIIEDFFVDTGLSEVGRCLKELGREDLEFQRRLLTASIHSISPVSHAVKSGESLSDNSDIETGSILDQAEVLGRQLKRCALRNGTNVRWVGLCLMDGNQWSVGELGLDMHTGLPGVALFLSHLARYSNDAELIELGRSATRTYVQRVEKGERLPRSLGAYAGIGGVIFGLTRLAQTNGDLLPLHLAEQLVEKIPRAVNDDNLFDMVYGSAGCLASLLALHSVLPNRRVLEVARLCGDALLRSSSEMDVGRAWINPIGKSRALAGFSHGAAGIIWPLLVLGSVADDHNYTDAALQALQYERSAFCAQTQNWLDLRPNGSSWKNTDHSQFTAWCHGASGIGFSRANMRGILTDKVLDTEMMTCLRTTLRHGFGANHSLCHGDLGNLDAGLVISSLLGDVAIKGELLDIARRSVRRIATAGVICGTPGNVESPGLMTGLAGVGYGLLRLAKPSEVPSILSPLLDSGVEKVQWTI
jgi:class II lanthipeptide synthase